MDLSKAFALGERTIDILNPETEKPTGLQITLVSLEDERVKKVESDFRSRSLSGNPKKALKRLAESSGELSKTRLAASIIKVVWGGEATWQGKKPELTPELADQLVDNPIIREQLEEAHEDTADFLKK